MPLLLPHLTTLRHALTALACTTLAATAALTTAAPAGAAVGSYAVQACSDGEHVGLPIGDAFGGWAGEVTRVDASHRVENDCGGSLGLFMQLKGSDRKAAGDLAAWRFTAPSATRVTDAVLSFDSYTRPSNGQTQGGFLITAAGQTIPLVAHHGRGLVAGTQSTFHGLSARSIRVAVYCEAAGSSSVDCPSGEDARGSVNRMVLTLVDDMPPSVSRAEGSALEQDTWRDSISLYYAAGDFGSGLSEFRAYVDGSLLVHHMPDSNGGACVPISDDGAVPMFLRPKPCVDSVDTNETINTNTIPDGPHQIDLVVADASGRETAIVSGVKVIANHPPVNDAVPAFQDGGMAAQPRVGDMLVASHGVWSGPGISFAVGWERCEADGSACGQIPGATVESYMPNTADVGKRLRMVVTATNPADSVTRRTAMTGAVVLPPPPPSDTDTGTGTGTGTGNGNDGAGSGSGSGTGGSGSGGTGGGSGAPPLPTSGGSGGGGSAQPEPDHALVGRVAGEPPTATCPQERAALVLQGVSGHTLKLRHGRRSQAQVLLTCAATGKAITGARLDVATRTGSGRAVASQATTDAAGHAVLRLAAGPSRAITVGYRMYADDPLARATVTLRVRVDGRIALRASRRSLRNGQAVTLSGQLAGGHVPRRGVDLAVQWRDGGRWRPFAQVRTDRRGRFHYAYRFTRTRGTVRYALRVQVVKGQVDYPFAPVPSKAVRVVVRP